MFWQWEKWDESNRGGEEGRKHLQTNPVILRSLLGSDMACDYLSLRNLVFC